MSLSQNEIHTPTADSCLPGITRKMIIHIANREGIKIQERNISNSELYTADEVFTSGTMGEITPILEADMEGKLEMELKDQSLKEFNHCILIMHLKMGNQFHFPNLNNWGLKIAVL